MSNRRTLIGIGMTAIAFGAAAQADITYISQTRSHFIELDNGAVSDSDAAADFSDFSSTLTAMGPTHRSSGTSTHFSSLGSSSMSSDTLVDVQVGLTEPFGSFSHGFRVQFMVDAQTTFDLEGELFDMGSEAGNAAFTLRNLDLPGTDPGHRIFSATVDAGGTTPFSTQVTLDAATTYEIFIGGDGEFFAGVPSFTHGARFSLVPAPGAAAMIGLGGLIATRRRRCAGV